jgi:hypothetical protein
MKQRRYGVAQWMLSGFLLTSSLSSCGVIRSHSPYGSRDHAYIHYWPVPPNNKQMRPAVKDNIDMKGVVTSSGSEFLIKNNPPLQRMRTASLPHASETSRSSERQTSVNFPWLLPASTTTSAPRRILSTSSADSSRRFFRRFSGSGRKRKGPTLPLERIPQVLSAYRQLFAALLA